MEISPHFFSPEMGSMNLSIFHIYCNKKNVLFVIDTISCRILIVIFSLRYRLFGLGISWGLTPMLSSISDCIILLQIFQLCFILFSCTSQCQTPGIPTNCQSLTRHFFISFSIVHTNNICLIHIYSGIQSKLKCTIVWIHKSSHDFTSLPFFDYTPILPFPHPNSNAHPRKSRKIAEKNR